MRRLFLVLLFAARAFAASDLTGTVVDDKGKPLAGARVYVNGAFPKLGVSAVCPTCYRDCGKNEAADAKGAFRLRALDDLLVFDILAVADGYEPRFAQRVDPKRGMVTIELPIRRTGQYVINGIVVDPAGKPVLGAIVDATGVHSITNAKGEFALFIPVAKLDVRITARTFAPRFERQLTPNEKRTIKLSTGATIVGRLMRADQPVSGAKIEFRQTDRNPSHDLGPASIGTNDNGYFFMTYLAPNEEYAVHATLPDGVVDPKIVRTEEEGSSSEAGTLNVGTGREIAGRVVLPPTTSLAAGSQITVTGDLTGITRTVTLPPDATFAFASMPNEPAHLTFTLPGVRVASVWNGGRPLPLTGNAAVLPAEGDVAGVRVVGE
ncbi:MAG: carboxypeptidase regulatory-like domain-containing protein [Acidobacteria bacterium]|nr:carboxypeptidase regulatory-like domain-containing protein [Acidobacteriota bacterium]